MAICKKICLLLCGILHELREIRKLLKKLTRVKFHASIVQKHTGENTNMAQITAGATGVFLFQVAASDNSTVSLKGITFNASDPSVTIANDPSDLTGATVDVTVPASDTATSFTLSAGALATTPTVNTPEAVSASLSVIIAPSTVPVTFTATIVQVK